jgi:cytochrome c biogenesis protein CcmG/thiol:disulfide interchange protein DsbE
MRRPAACLIAAILLATACARSGSTPRPDNVIGGGSARGLRAALEEMRGKPVVVNYWATWCVPCQKEMPRLVAAANKFAGRVGFLGVDVEDDGDAAADFVKRYKMPFRSLADERGAIRRSQKLLGLPATQFYSADGELAFLHQGEIKARELENRIDDLLGG